MSITERLRLYGESCEKFLDEIMLRGGETPQKLVFESMRYSVSGGGKRIRPALTFMFYKLFDNEWQKALPYAAALEMIHTYSLIHDDLPCMDDDDYRRGRPSNHRVYGDGIALLTGDALLGMAFETVLDDTAFSPDKVKRAAQVLAHLSGVYGMLGGQIIDVKESIGGIEQLTDMYALKTGALLACGCKMGCILGGADERQINEAGLFGVNLGIAFQIIDDILDACGDENKMGKKTGSDQKLDKVTFVTLLGIDGARKAAAEYTERCMECLDCFENTEEIDNLAKYLLNREY